MCWLGFLLKPVPASSRVNPLAQDYHMTLGLRSTCGSGFTRERAGTGNKNLTARPQSPAHP
ncbi:hypothetical protein B8W72_26650 [Pseudomonas putida]|uniref:Uncharacterized protein n=1 Tax=Pseudomonas putida TaxID=303 RepID=A0A1Y3KGD9_PSEPU|nr:hypothetical protein B8W72_26650 [Pseudomonas putida]